MLYYIRTTFKHVSIGLDGFLDSVEIISTCMYKAQARIQKFFKGGGGGGGGENFKKKIFFEKLTNPVPQKN